MLAPYHFGIGVSAGTEITPLLANLLLSSQGPLHSTHVFLALDFRAAYDNESRAQLLEAIHEHMPTLLPLALFKYTGANKSIFFISDKTSNENTTLGPAFVPSVEGGDQG